MPLLWLSLAFCAGVFCARYVALPAGLWFGAAGFFIVLSILITKIRLFESIPFLGDIRLRLRRIIPLPLWIIAATLCVGAGRFQIANPPAASDFIAFYNDTQDPLAVVGMISEPHEVRDTFTYLKVAVSSVRPLAAGNFKDVPAHGNLWVRVEKTMDDWQYGDVIEVHGLVQSPLADFPTYGDILAARAIFSTMTGGRPRLIAHTFPNVLLDRLYRFKNALVKEIYRLYPDPEASLLAGILFGEDANIPEAVQHAFQETGTAHIIAISGFNMNIVAGLLAMLFGRISGRWKRLAVILVGIAGYAILAGGSASVLRAALMSGSGLLAKQLGRRQDGINTLAFTAALLCIFNPRLLWDVGFQLSYTATLGMLLYADPFTNAFTRLAGRFLPNSFVEKAAKPVGEYFLLTLAAQVVSLPVILYHIQQLSISALAVNPVVLPVQPAVMILGGISILLGFIFHPLGQIATALAWPFLLYTIRIVELFSRLFGAAYKIEEFSSLAALAWYGMLFSIPYLRSGWKKWLPVFSPGLVLTLLGSITVFVWQAVLAGPHGRLELTVLNTGGAGSLYILTPGDKRILIDGGARPSALRDGLGRRLPAFDRRLDLLILTGTSKTKLGGLLDSEVSIDPHLVLAAPGWQDSEEIQSILSSLKNKAYDARGVESGQRIDIEDGTHISFLAINSQGMLVLLEKGDFRALICTSLQADFIRTAAKMQVPVTVLFLTDNGSKIIDLAEWVAAVNPQVVVLSGLLDDRGDQGEMKASRSNVLQIDRYRWLDFASDGRTLWAAGEEQ